MIHPRLKQFAHSGEMGKLVATYDWAKTSLGDPSTWPHSLVTTLGIVLENKISMYMVWGKEMIQFYNDAYIPILGAKHPQALGRPSRETWLELWDTIGPLFQEVYHGGAVHFDNLPLTINLNGKMEERFFIFSYTPIRLEDGSVGGVLDTVIDTTSEIRYKKSLEISEESFRNYQEQSPNPFLSLNEDWTITYINPAAMEVLRFQNKKVVGEKIWEVFPGSEETIFGESYKRAMTGETVTFEGYYPGLDSWYNVFAYHLSPGIGIIFQDITESKRLQAELSNAVKARDQFLSIASHELKTPLTSLKLQAQILERELKKGMQNLNEERITKFAQQTSTQVTRLTHLVDDMLDVSRIATGKLAVEKKDADFKKILTDACERMSPLFEGGSSGRPAIKFEGQDFHGKWDAYRMEQVINNLLTNALRYGEGKPVEVSLIEKDGLIEFKVSDHGRGISEEDQKIIFEQFARGDNTEVGEGLGLGLFIAKEIVHAHHGSISVESQLGEGTTFTLRLPRSVSE